GQGLEAPAHQLGPALRELLDELRLDGADRTERKLEVRAIAAVAQLERGDAECNAQMKGPGKLQVAVVRPAGNRRQHSAAVLPGLDDEAAQAPLQAESRRLWANEGMSPPAAGVRGEGLEHRGPRRGDRYIQCHVHNWN